MTTDNAIHDQANRDHYATMPTRRVTIRVEVEADVEWRDDDPDYCEQLARTETAWGEGARCNNRTARVLSVVVEHPVATKAVTEPQTEAYRWPEPGSYGIADSIVAWINANGGEARYETFMDRKHYPNQMIVNGPINPRIVITGPDGPRYMAPGDEVVKGERWFEVYASDRDWSKKRLREFTVRRPTPEETREADHG